ncbi:hypothetical protein WN51_07957 [Melipona quadrifasciata]|uniref:Uncharacterized protein n=1 Tax=Melipona quadrifasciata TaxID=166423 RepID=A0A0M8ZRX4_9HYME|nr:hypothetical protein WN51_07957 [Melipona quadrifasciata]
MLQFSKTAKNLQILEGPSETLRDPVDLEIAVKAISPLEISSGSYTRLSWNVSPENLGHMAALSSKQETNKALDRGLMHGANFPEHVRSTGQRDDSGWQGVSGPSCPTLDPRFSVAEGRGTEETVIGCQAAMIPRSEQSRSFVGLLRLIGSLYENSERLMARFSPAFTVSFGIMTTISLLTNTGSFKPYSFSVAILCYYEKWGSRGGSASDQESRGKGRQLTGSVLHYAAGGKIDDASELLKIKCKTNCNLHLRSESVDMEDKRVKIKESKNNHSEGSDGLVRFPSETFCTPYKIILMENSGFHKFHDNSIDEECSPPLFVRRRVPVNF